MYNGVVCFQAKTYRHLANIYGFADAYSYRNGPRVVAILFPIRDDSRASSDGHSGIEIVVPEVLNVGRANVGSIIITRK